MKEKKSRTKKFARAGYRIHFDRLRDISEGFDSVIRTHKFKCQLPKNEGGTQELKQKFEDVARVVDSSEEGSLIWFLVQMYGLGFCIARTPEYKRKWLKILDEDFEDPAEKLKVISPKNIISTNALLNFFLKDKRGSDQQWKSFQQKERKDLPTFIYEFLSIFEISYEELHDSEVYPLFQKIINILEQKGIKGFGENIKNIFADYFGIEEYRLIQKEDSVTFFYNPTFFHEKGFPVDKKFEITEVLFSAIFPAAKKLGEKLEDAIKELTGTANKQGGLSNFFNVNEIFGELCKSTEKAKEIIQKQNPHFFSKNEDLLDFLSKKVWQLTQAKFVNQEQKEIRFFDPKNDFLKENWYEYRNLFGGRLEGWLSNFQNRLQLFESSLTNNEASLDSEEKIKNKKKKNNKKITPHKKIFEQIANNCDWQNIFPSEQQTNFSKLQELRANLFNALRVLKGEPVAKSNPRDFGSLLDEYNQYLQSFREFLMKWNNEGIPQFIVNENGDKIEVEKKRIEKLLKKTPKKAPNKPKKNSEEEEDHQEIDTNKNIIGYWSAEFVPSELDCYPRFIGQSQKNPIEEIKKASETIFKLIEQALEFTRKIREENPKDENLKWVNGKKGVGHGLLHKNLEILKNLALRYELQDLIRSQSFKFLEKFIDLSNQEPDSKQKEIWQNIKEVSQLSNKELIIFLKQEKKDNKEKNRDLTKIKFFVSGYEYRNKSFLSVKNTNFTDYLKEFESHFGLQNLQSEAQIKNWLGFQGDNISWYTLERGEILKIYLSLLFRDLTNKINLPQLSEDKILRLRETSLPSLIFNKDNKLLESGEIANIRRFVASSIGSEIRSKISILSRQEFIKRNVIQITSGQQSMLSYVPLEWEDFGRFDKIEKISGKRKKLTAKRLTKLKSGCKKSFSKKAEEVLDSAGIDKTKSNLEITKEIWKFFNKQTSDAKKELAQILAQIPHRWEVILKTKQSINNLEPVSEGFFIEKSDEKDVFNFCTKKSDHLYSFPIETSICQKQFLEKFLWGDKKEILTEKILGSSLILERVINAKTGQEKDFSLYLAIPFQFSKEGEKPAKENPNKGKYRISTKDQTNILGIDLGEYGFGYAVFNSISGEFEESKFLEIPLLKKMRDSAARWKDSQASGIFSRPTTHLAELREQAAGQVRNQIHHLAIIHNAIPVYEDSVDGFESGGQRITKLYKTLKTADVISGGSNTADGDVRKHFWGSKFASIGGVIGASKTSQTCRHCGVCKTSEIEEQIKNASGDEKKKLEDELNKVKKFQRTEMPSKEKKKFGKRGSDAWFMCQNCGNQTDADEQAAQNIALKYFFAKFVATDSDKKEEKYLVGKDGKKQFSSLKFFLEKSKEEQYRNIVQ